jgi:hypothetical protein
MGKWHYMPGDATDTHCPICGRKTGVRVHGEERDCADCRRVKARTYVRRKAYREMTRKAAAKGRPVLYYGLAGDDPMTDHGGKHYRVAGEQETREIVELRRALGMPAVLGPDGRWEESG